MVTKSDDAGQVPLLIVHKKVFAPMLNPVTADAGELGEIGLPVPETNVHIPVPIVGVFPANDENDAHIVWSAPALAVVGFASTLIVTKSSEGEQVPFEILHLKTFAPTLNPVTADVGKFTFVIVPVPETKDQVPVPVVGVFPVKLDELAQIVWSIPALAVVGGGSTVMVTKSVDAGQVPLVIVH
jgi:MFS superfamily sulfate permease-like transporter